MAAANFFDNPAPFPIYAMSGEALQAWVCPDCDVELEYDEASESWTCPECGCSTTYPEDDGCYRDYYRELWRFDEIAGDLSEAAGALRFWRVSFETGYYSGAQVRVRLPEDPRELENADCRELWDLCRSRAVSALEAETRRLKRALDAFADERGMLVLRVAGRFSSGEAVYEKVA